MHQPMELTGMEARVSENNLPCVSCRRVMLEHRLYVSFNASEKASHALSADYYFSVTIDTA
jgi:hypothetical protein